MLLAYSGGKNWKFKVVLESVGEKIGTYFLRKIDFSLAQPLIIVLDTWHFHQIFIPRLFLHKNRQLNIFMYSLSAFFVLLGLNEHLCIFYRVGGGFKCPGILEVCCNESIKSKKTPETDMARRNIDKKIWKSFRTTPHPPPPSDRCTCVPHHLCRNQTINVAPKQLITEMGYVLPL